MTDELRLSGRGSAQHPITEARRETFLKTLRETGIFVWASRAASPHAQERHGCASSFRSLMARDPAFKVAVQEAQEEADAELLRAARRRAVDGIPRGIYQKGTRVIERDGSDATEYVYSDRLLEILLKSRFPNDFIERKAVEHSGSVGHHAEPGLLIRPSDLALLSPSQREALGDVLETLARARGELPPQEPIDVTPAEPEPELIEHHETETMDALTAGEERELQEILR